MNQGTSSSSFSTSSIATPLTPRRKSRNQLSAASTALGHPDAAPVTSTFNDDDGDMALSSNVMNSSSTARGGDEAEDLVPLVGHSKKGGGTNKNSKSAMLALEVDQDPDAHADNSITDDDDHSHHDHHHGVGPPGSANSVQMVINIIISFVGAGLLGQPHAFMESGWMLGGIALLVVSALNVYAMLRLPAVQQALLKRSPQLSASAFASYSDIGRAILGPRGESLVIACLGISQAGFATAYIIFIAANIFSIAKVPRFWVCLFCIPGLIGLVQFQDLKSLSPFSLLANVANFCALSAVLFQDYESYEPHDDTIHAVQWGGLLYVIAITIYSMEGVGLVLSLQASYQHPQRFGMLLSVTLAVISTFMAVFGAAGYWAFGDATEAPITLNLASHWSATFVKLALCLGLYLTYPIMMFPIWSIAEQNYPRLQSDVKARTLVRAGAVVASATVAFVMPNFGTFLSLVGSSICTLLGFVFPCWFHLRACGKELSWWQYGLDVAILSGGCLFGVLGTIQSVRAMWEGDPME
jgi:proton-coupled amino acid transporter